MDFLQTNGNQVTTWSQRTTPQSFSQAGTGNGICEEYIIKLCNTAQANPWINIPAMVDSNYVVQFATMLKDSLDSNLKVYIEYSNEVWNGEFQQNTYANQQASKKGMSGGAAQYYATRAVSIFKTFASIFGSTNRLVRVICWQQGGLSNPLQSVIAPGDTAYRYCDAGAVAPYFGNEIDNDSAVAKMSVNEILDWVENSINFKSSDMLAQARYLNSLRNNENNPLQFMAYEAGREFAAPLSE